MNKMTDKKNNIILRGNSNGEEFPLIIEDLIPVHSSSTMKNDAGRQLSTEDFDRAVALIWNALMESSENSSAETIFNSAELWGPKQVSDA